MGKDFDSPLHQQHSPWQPPNLNCTSFSPYPGWQNTRPAYTNPYPCVVSANGSLPEFAVSELPYLKASQPNVHHGWFYCLPRHRQALTPTPNYAPKEFSALPSVGRGEVSVNAVPTVGQKGFLVFDQSGYHTSLIFNSLIGPPVQHLNSGNPKPLSPCALPVEVPTIKKEPIYQAKAVFSDGLDENQGTVERSEMHEDTEELNALLYSDEDDDYEDEETSTGHSPFEEEAGYEMHANVEESAEEVASSAGPAKRKRQQEEEYDALSDTAGSGKPNGLWECEEEAESSCVEGRTQGGEMGFLSANKRLKRDRIQETVSILKSIIPGGKGKDDVMFVLDEAIEYLRILKLKAKYLGEIVE